VAISIRVSGPLACLTRPELKVERMSYPVITPSAARGVLEAVLWKPAIQWHIDRIHVLAPIQFTAFRRNEVNSRAAAPAVAVIAAGGEHADYFADEDRAQRNTVALRAGSIFISRISGAENSPRMFRRWMTPVRHLSPSRVISV